MPDKFFCYVDETGQHTKGCLFIVSVVVVPGPQREEALELCEAVERTTGKGKVKWAKANRNRRHNYMREVLKGQPFEGGLTFAMFRNNRQDYPKMTYQTIAMALQDLAGDDYKATVRIDGLPKHQEREVGRMLRRRGLRVNKVRGVKDEGDSLIRLADALCGLVRNADQGVAEMATLFEQRIRQGVLRDPSG